MRSRTSSVSLTKSHVQLCKAPISWKLSEDVIRGDEGVAARGSGGAGSAGSVLTRQVFFDTLHEELIMLTRAEDGPANVSISDHRRARWVECDCSVPDPQVVRMKFSEGRAYLALQVSIREVKVVDISRGRLVAARSCRSHKSRITNIYWCASESPDEHMLLFVTNTGAELYTLRSNSTLKHVKTVQQQTRYHWFVNGSNWLMVVDLKHVFSLYKIGNRTVTRRCKFELNCRGTNYNSRNEAYFHQISLFEMYGELMCVFVNEKKGKLHLLGVQKESMKQLYVYDLMSPSRYEVSVVDNVFVVHNMLAKVALLFDVRTDVNAFLAAPLPIAHDQYEGNSEPPLSPGTLTPDAERFLKIKKRRARRPEDRKSVEVAPGSADFKQSATPEPGAEVRGDGKTLPDQYAADQDATDPSIAEVNTQQSISSSPPNHNRVRSHFVQEFKYENWSFLPEKYILDNSAAKTMNVNTLWTMKLDLRAVSHSWPMGKRDMLVDFLLKRKEGGSKRLLLRVLTDMLVDATALRTVSRLFNLLNRVCYEAEVREARARQQAAATDSKGGTMTPDKKRALDAKGSGIPGGSPAASATDLTSPGSVAGSGSGSMAQKFIPQGYTVVSQSDILDHVFTAAANRGRKPKDLFPYVAEYIRSACRHFLKISPALNQLLIDLLVTDSRYFELHQYLQYHVLRDSLAFAKRLIRLKSVYPPGYQLGLDMLYRLGAFTEMMRILLGNKQVLEALQLVPHTSGVFREKGLTPDRFLAVALDSGSASAFYTAFRFFQMRNQALRSSPAFLPEDGCGRFVRAFERVFHPKAEATDMAKALQVPEGGAPGSVFMDSRGEVLSAPADFGVRVAPPPSPDGGPAAAPLDPGKGDWY